MTSSEFGLWFQLLGPVQARCDGRLLRLGGPKPRALLAALLDQVNKVIGTDRLIALVWGHEAEVGRDSVYHYISGLKAALTPAAGRVTLEGLRPNYRLVVADPERTVDWHRFRSLLAQATSAREVGDSDDARVLLQHALELWRGEPLADIGDALPELRHAMSTRRIGAAEDLAQLELQHGDPDQVVDLLTGLCERHPERERAAALLVRALNAVGRRDDAVDVYRRTRSHIVATLGLDPHGPLEEAYALLTRAPARNRRALRAGLQAPAGHFVGRHKELTEVRDVLCKRSPADEVPNGAVVCVIHGMAGTGKTQLALQAAHAVADEFPDDPLFIDLQGYTPDAEPVDPVDALGQLLRMLGVPVTKIPQELHERATLYRATLADKAMLIILDNAGTTNQVQPLLPAAPGCRVIITTRKRLTALDDAHPIRLDVLAPDPARELFVAISALATVEQNMEVVSRIVSRCGRLPLAIRILAARYRDKAWSTLSDLDAQLADEHERLGLLDDGERSVTAAFTVSYQSLPEDQRRMFRLLALVPGPESVVDAYDATALLGTSLPTAQQLLDRLVANGLLTQPVPGRYAFHDLLRAYAVQLASEDSDTDQHGALSRLLDHYAHTASLAMNLYAPFEPHRRPPLPPAATPAPGLRDTAQARAWLDAHQRTLVAAATHAAVNGWPSHATHLSQTLFRYLEARLRHDEALALYNTALHAARLTGDRSAEAHTLNDIARIEYHRNRTEQARDQLTLALQIDRQTGDLSGEARTLGNLANVHSRLGNHDEAVECRRAAVQLYVALGDHASVTRATVNMCSLYYDLGRYDEMVEHLQRALAQDSGDRGTAGSAHALLANAYRQLERYDEAIDHHERALALQRETGNLREEAETLNELAQTLRSAHHYHDAIARHVEALALARQADNRRVEACAHDGLAHTYLDLGERRQAVEHWTQALMIAGELELPLAKEIRLLLARLGPAAEEREGDVSS